MSLRHSIGLKTVLICFSGLLTMCTGQRPAEKVSLASNNSSDLLAGYRANLEAFRAEYGGSVNMPDVRFFLFGMGNRTKLIYRDGLLKNAVTGKTVKQWKVRSEIIVPSEYAVFITTAGGKEVEIVEDQEGVWIEEDGSKTAVTGTQNSLNLPRFEGHKYAPILRVLHQEILVNIINGLAVPNYLVYPKPWYRDGAMMAMCLKETGNLDLMKDWILGLTEPYDRNNAGETEADNLGQGLYLVSLVSDKNHPVVQAILNELPRHEVTDSRGKYIKGRSDFAEHPVYQTKWAKYGLASLGLEDPYYIPLVKDSYSSLFWMDYKERYVPGSDAFETKNYPYLAWATDHFHGLKRSPISNRDYPLTWERKASQAKYSGMEAIDRIYADKQISTPHTWHAAEIFLLLLEE